jgi:hypothetical protein
MYVLTVIVFDLLLMIFYWWIGRKATLIHRQEIGRPYLPVGAETTSSPSMR